MAISDETPTHRQYLLHQNICSATTANPTLAWYLHPSRYERKVGNSFTPFFSGEQVFQSIADSIKGAQKTIDIISWGFDPAIPLVRTDGVYSAQGTHSGWRKEDSYGEILLSALEKNPQLEIKIVIWYYDLNAAKNQTQNIVGLGNRLWYSLVALDKDLGNTGFDPAVYDATGTLNALPMRQRSLEAQAYSRQWFMDTRVKERLAFVFRDIKDRAGGRGVKEEDPLLDRFWKSGALSGEPMTLSFPTDHQKTVLIDYEAPANCHAYVMGHNSKTEYWSEFPFKHRSLKNELDYRPFHDFSIKIKGPLVIDINENFCDAWESYETTSNIVLGPTSFEEDNQGDIVGIYPEHPFLDNQKKTALRERRKVLRPQLEALTPGQATGQIVRTRPDINIKINGRNVQEKEIKDAYMQVTRHARNYVLIVNQYCQYAKLIRHIKHWRRQYMKRCNDNSNTLYILMGSCWAESHAMVFRSHSMANELGLGNAFGIAEEEMYNADGSSKGAISHTPAKVNMGELEELNIKPLYFSFYTQAPMGELAQQVYVHAKLMVLDDAFFTLGSANLNIRSMAVDSELNLISEDLTAAKDFRHTLFEGYIKPTEEEVEEGQFFNPKEAVLEQAEMKKIHAIFSQRSQDNLELVNKKETISGHVVQFVDKRGVVGVIRQG